MKRKIISESEKKNAEKIVLNPWSNNITVNQSRSRLHIFVDATKVLSGKDVENYWRVLDEFLRFIPKKHRENAEIISNKFVIQDMSFIILFKQMPKEVQDKLIRLAEDVLYDEDGFGLENKEFEYAHWIKRFQDVIEKIDPEGKCYYNPTKFLPLDIKVQEDLLRVVSSFFHYSQDGKVPKVYRDAIELMRKEAGYTDMTYIRIDDAEFKVWLSGFED